MRIIVNVRIRQWVLLKDSSAIRRKLSSNYKLIAFNKEEPKEKMKYLSDKALLRR